MITSPSCSGAARQAHSILYAWENRDAWLLRTELDRALLAEASSDYSSGEAERNELLQGIARTIRATGTPVEPGFDREAEQIEVCISLLRHLAATAC